MSACFSKLRQMRLQTSNFARGRFIEMHESEHAMRRGNPLSTVHISIQSIRSKFFTYRKGCPNISPHDKSEEVESLTNRPLHTKSVRSGPSGIISIINRKATNHSPVLRKKRRVVNRLPARQSNPSRERQGITAQESKKTVPECPDASTRRRPLGAPWGSRKCVDNPRSRSRSECFFVRRVESNA